MLPWRFEEQKGTEDKQLMNEWKEKSRGASVISLFDQAPWKGPLGDHHSKPHNSLSIIYGHHSSFHKAVQRHCCGYQLFPLLSVCPSSHRCLLPSLGCLLSLHNMTGVICLGRWGEVYLKTFVSVTTLYPLQGTPQIPPSPKAHAERHAKQADEHTNCCLYTCMVNTSDSMACILCSAPWRSRNTYVLECNKNVVEGHNSSHRHHLRRAQKDVSTIT